MMELPLVLIICHFLMDFKPIFEFIFFPLVIYIMSQKKGSRFLDVFRPNQKSKMVKNGKNNTNPTGSSHAKQLQPKRHTPVTFYTIKICEISSIYVCIYYSFSFLFEKWMQTENGGHQKKTVNFRTLT